MDTEPPRATPVRRADAERNRGRILAVALAAFAERDADASMPDVSMAEISRRAGVGMATLYRNFPNRRRLLEAVYVDEVDAICTAADAPAGRTSLDRLLTWLDRFVAFSAGKRPVAFELLAQAPDSEPFLTDNRARVLAAARPLLAAAQGDRAIRDDVTIEQLLDLVVAIGSIPGDAAYVHSILQTVLDGLRLRPIDQDGN